ncbi:D-amino acid aminotransferase [Isoalcanivorax indicus]|uniref:D-amino acid aminotransferase n=1 Tax=Isoalcanivorax indicus TaxID=2202653 RepID=UPI000DBA7D3E|nr:D-amino acid aminotransferase [Isoalcanivorax indicus]
MSTAYLNGTWQPLEDARISPLDRGFLFADGVYEVIPVYAGTPFRLAEHLARLAFSLAQIQLVTPLDDAGWTSLINELIERNGGGNLSLYLQVTRGATSKRDHAFPPAGTDPTVFAMVSPMAPAPADTPDTTPGVTAITLPDCRWLRCDIKSVSLLPNILMRQQAVSQGAAEAILLRDGEATEGSASNLFIVAGGTVITCPKSPLILGGITRDLILELCRQHGVPCAEQPISEAALRSADEIWVTSSTREIVPVVTLDGATVGSGRPGPVWRQVAGLYTAFKRALADHA